MIAQRQGCAVFLVEDEALIRMMVADMLTELGCSVAAEAGNIELAIRLAEGAVFDLAVLDVNVGGKLIFPVADVIRGSKRPYIFATGYDASIIPEPHQDQPALRKPFQIEKLGNAIDTVLKDGVGRDPASGGPLNQ